MQGDTITVITLAIALVFSENPFGTVEIFGFPVAYLIAGTLLLYGLDMRKAILDERSVSETVPLSQMRNWSGYFIPVGEAQEERMCKT